jgi:adenosylmethionine-8-amino-7-oxononanoate aminotransferase
MPWDMKSNLYEIDRNHLWHPYSSMKDPLPVYPVVKALGTRII